MKNLTLRYFGLMALAVMMLGGRAWGQTTITSLSTIAGDMAGSYVIEDDIDASGYTTVSGTFTGTLSGKAKDDGTFPVISGLTQPLFTTATGAIISNIMLKNVHISQNGIVGAITCTANGATKIYNCGILPTTPSHQPNIAEQSNNRSTVASANSSNCGSLVGKLDGTARVINCFSFADVTKGGSAVGGLVGNNSQTSKQNDLKTIVVNCMFYGDIKNCSSHAPVYGNNAIENNSDKGINPYCFFSAKEGNFADASFNNYKRTWPADDEYLTRFEYYRNILNSNRQLMAWWVSGNIADTVLIAKWVLDPSIAPYPILKKWGKYPSIINPHKTKTIDPRRVDDDGNPLIPIWKDRSTVSPYQGKILNTLAVKVKPGSHASSTVQNTYGTNGKPITLNITDMDTLNHDYGYYKVQLPYYNEQFGDPSADPVTHWETRYGGNYTDSVVTGWKITSITGGTQGIFVGDVNKTQAGYQYNSRAWESGFNFADRYCTSKDLYDVSGRVFAQGGFFYVPEGVSAITIEAYWGKAVYLHNKGHYLDRVNITAKSGNRTVGDPFALTDPLPATFQNHDVWDEWHTAVTKLDAATLSDNVLNITVYDQAIVLLSNYQIKNQDGAVGYNIDNKWHPYTLMSIDQDLDNEPDYCFELQFRGGFNRRGIQPIRFDFLPIPELGLAVRHNTQLNAIGIFIPLGHFEITETSCMHTTQFEYDAQATGSGTGYSGPKVPAPIILNGGHFEQIVARYGPQNNTQYFLMGGHFRMLRFTPGAHTSRQQSSKIRLCAVNVIGGDFPEFYLSGIYRPDIVPESIAKQGNPHCYTNGGRFGFMAGSGYDKILGDITFKIDHSIIREFYGGGINGANPVGGSIDVTIDHSLVLEKYCGGPKVGTMTTGKTVTTHATGTIFKRFYGGGNGGTSYYREQGYDGNDYNVPAMDSAGWAAISTAKYKEFNPLNTRTGGSLSAAYDNTKGYHALYEFECFVESNGLGGKPTLRTYTHWAQFGATSTGNVTNNLDNCTVEENLYGGGNLANVSGTITTTLKDCTIKGNAYGGGYSGRIEPFRIHNKAAALFPYIDKAGVMQNGSNGTNSCKYLKNADDTDRYYTWCFRKSNTVFLPNGVVIPSTANTSTGRNATFEYPEGSNNWYVLTTVSLEGLGAVSGNVELNLTGITTVGTDGDPDTGNVFGGGNESIVNGNASVTIEGTAEVKQNVFGGGNQAEVGQNTTVILQEGAHVLGNVYGGGNNGPVQGDSKVIIQNE